jgi:hypothetical protein
MEVLWVMCASVMFGSRVPVSSGGTSGSFHFDGRSVLHL